MPNSTLTFRRTATFGLDSADYAWTQPVTLKEILHNESATCACMACQSADKSDAQYAPGSNTFYADDTVPADTTTTVSVPLGGYIQGSIDSATDADWFLITLTAGQTYTFSTIVGSLDTILRLRDSTGAEITSNDDAATNGSVIFSEITYTATASGTYYLDVRGFGGDTGSFFLTSTAPVADNITAGTSTTATLTIGAAATNGTLQSNGDHDWYAVTLEAGVAYEIITTAPGGTAVADTTLMIRNSSGVLQAYNDDISSTNTLSRVRFTPTTTGTYYVDVGAWGNNESGAYNVNIAIAPPLPNYTGDQIANQLTYGNAAGTGTAERFDVRSGGTLTVNITALTADGQTLAREALNLWADVTGIRFSEVSTGGQITFDDNEAGAFAQPTVAAGGIITSARVNVSSEWLTTYGTTLRGYAFTAYVHEVGHALGLNHPGNYNAAALYSQDAVFENDSWATTIMSYFSQTANTYFNAQGFTRQFPTSPLTADILAVGQLYGAATDTRTGNTVYGVGNTSGRAIYDASTTDAPMTVTIFDNGGIDTLNYSVYTADQRIDLRPEVFSNIGGRVGNLTIARGTIIENATGGSGFDIITGNDANNELRGGGSRDGILGGAGDDRIFGDDGVDYLVGGTGNDAIEGGNNPDEIHGEDGNDTLTGGTSFDTDLLYGGAGDDILYGDSTLGDYDVMEGGTGNDRYYVDTPADVVTELANAGTDTVFANVNGTGYFLSANVENLTLQNTTQFGVGNALNNTLLGSDAANGLYGRDGNDVLNGRGGNDILFGDAGNDIFVFTRGGGSDTVGDFTRGVDRIDVSNFGLRSLAEVQALFYQDTASGAGAIQFSTGDVAIFLNTVMSQLTAADFIFAVAAQAAKVTEALEDLPISAFAPDSLDFGNTDFGANDNGLLLMQAQNGGILL
jgi:serralysin